MKKCPEWFPSRSPSRVLSWETKDCQSDIVVRKRIVGMTRARMQPSSSDTAVGALIIPIDFWNKKLAQDTSVG